jgi:hypothetical protein
LDLALLKVKDKSFWEGAEFGHLQTKMPCQNDVVYTLGFPSDLAQLNYYSLSINEGIVSSLVPGIVNMFVRLGLSAIERH